MATLYFNAAVDGDWQTLGNWWTSGAFTTQASALPTSSDSVVLSTSCDTNSGSAPTVVNLTANGGYFSIPITVSGNATFNDYAGNGDTITGNATFNDYAGNYSTVSGNAVFNGNSFNGYYGSGTVGGDATFNDSAYNTGTVTGNATFTASAYDRNPVVGTVSGTVTFNSLTPVAFTITNDSWSTDPSSWVFTTAGQNWTFNSNNASSLVGGVTITGTATFNGDAKAEPSVNFDGDGNVILAFPNVIGDATFNDTSYNNGGTVSGDATFNDSAYNNGTVTGDAVFNDSSYNNSGTVNGNAVFNGTSVNNNGTVTGSATFSVLAATLQISGGYTVATHGSVSIVYEKGINGSSILGVI